MSLDSGRVDGIEAPDSTRRDPIGDIFDTGTLLDEQNTSGNVSDELAAVVAQSIAADTDESAVIGDTNPSGDPEHVEEHGGEHEAQDEAPLQVEVIIPGLPLPPDFMAGMTTFTNKDSELTDLEDDSVSVFDEASSQEFDAVSSTDDDYSSGETTLDPDYAEGTPVITGDDAPHFPIGNEWLDSLTESDMNTHVTEPEPSMIEKRLDSYNRNILAAQEVIDTQVRTTHVFTDYDQLLRVGVLPAEKVLARTRDRLTIDKRIEGLEDARDESGNSIVQMISRSEEFRGPEVGAQLLRRLVQLQEQFGFVQGINSQVMDKIMKAANKHREDVIARMGPFSVVERRSSKPLHDQLLLNEMDSWKVIQAAYIEVALDAVRESHAEIYASYRYLNEEERWGVDLIGDLDDVAENKGWRLGRDYQVRGKGGDSSGFMFLPIMEEFDDDGNKISTILDDLVDSVGGERSNAIVNIGEDNSGFMVLSSGNSKGGSVSPVHSGGYLIIGYDPFVPGYDEAAGKGSNAPHIETDVLFMQSDKERHDRKVAVYQVKVIHLTDLGHNIMSAEIERLKRQIETQDGRFVNPIPRLRKMHQKNVEEGKKIAAKVDQNEAVRAAFNRLLDENRVAITSDDDRPPVLDLDAILESLADGDENVLGKIIAGELASSDYSDDRVENPEA